MCGLPRGAVFLRGVLGSLARRPRERGEDDRPTLAWHAVPHAMPCYSIFVVLGGFGGAWHNIHGSEVLSIAPPY